MKKAIILSFLPYQAGTYNAINISNDAFKTQTDCMAAYDYNPISLSNIINYCSTHNFKMK